jgi:hypothetical protein
MHVRIVVAAALAGLAALTWVRDREQQRMLRQIDVELQELRSQRPSPPVLLAWTPPTAAAIAPPSPGEPPTTAAVPAPSPAEPAAPSHDEARPRPSLEQRQAMDRASRLVDEALAHGRFESADLGELRRQVALANLPQEAFELARRIAVGINTDTLSIPSHAELLGMDSPSFGR